MYREKEIDTHKHGAVSKYKKAGECATVPEFKRLNYFYGQMLGAADFQAEQNYFREKLKLHNRCLHGYGTVCGLEVEPLPLDPDCEPEGQSAQAYLKDESGVEGSQKEKHSGTGHGGYNQTAENCEEEKRTKIKIHCGLALDCEGNEIVVREPICVDLWKELSKKDRQAYKEWFKTDPNVRKAAPVLYVSICYCEQPIEPARPVITDTCGASPDCVFGKLRDSVSVKVTMDKPDDDLRCEACCDACGDPCLLLARIDSFIAGQEIAVENVHNEVRRQIGTYTLTTITGINWVHGGTYKLSTAKKVLGIPEDDSAEDDGTGGIEVTFSRPVLTSSLKRGVVDLWVVEGGKGNSGQVYYVDGEFMDLPATPTTTSFRYRPNTYESIEYEDRLLIVVRTAFILDKCCRPVDGVHVGGRVPLLPGSEELEDANEVANNECVHPPPGYGPWTSGSGTPGSTFESWIYVRSKPEHQQAAKQKSGKKAEENQ